MKKFIICTCLVLGISCIANAETQKTWGLRWDRMLHFEAGTISSICVTQWSKKYLNIREDYGFFGITISALGGSYKEYRDHDTFNPTKWGRDGKLDFCWTVIGGIFGKFLTYTF